MESGLVVVAPIRKVKSSAWAFLKPFTIQMWCVTGAFFLLVGIVIWILEHRVNTEFRGPPTQQLITICWLVITFLLEASKSDSIFVLSYWVGSCSLASYSLLKLLDRKNSRIFLLFFFCLLE